MATSKYSDNVTVAALGDRVTVAAVPVWDPNQLQYAAQTRVGSLLAIDDSQGRGLVAYSAQMPPDATNASNALAADWQVVQLNLCSKNG